MMTKWSLIPGLILSLRVGPNGKVWFENANVNVIIAWIDQSNFFCSFSCTSIQWTSYVPTDFTLSSQSLYVLDTEILIILAHTIHIIDCMYSCTITDFCWAHHVIVYYAAFCRRHFIVVTVVTAMMITETRLSPLPDMVQQSEPNMSTWPKTKSYLPVWKLGPESQVSCHILQSYTNRGGDVVIVTLICSLVKLNCDLWQHNNRREY